MSKNQAFVLAFGGLALIGIALFLLLPGGLETTFFGVKRAAIWIWEAIPKPFKGIRDILLILTIYMFPLAIGLTVGVKFDLKDKATAPRKWLGYWQKWALFLAGAFVFSAGWMHLIPLILKILNSLLIAHFKWAGFRTSFETVPWLWGLWAFLSFIGGCYYGKDYMNT